MYFPDPVEDISRRNHLWRGINSRIRFMIEKISLVQLIVCGSIALLISKTLMLQLGSGVGRNLGAGK
jgi:hypothetical protein